MIKYIMRRPLIPILLLLVLTFEVVFMGSLKKRIADDAKLVEEMYDTTDITFDVLPGMNSAGTLTFRMHAGDRIERTPFFKEAFHYVQCPYTLREPEKILGEGSLFGTNNLPWFLKDWKVEAEYLEGYEDFLNKKDSAASGDVWKGNADEIPCIAEKGFMDEHGLKLGDSFVAAPYDGLEFDYEKAPNGYMKIVGCFENKIGPIMDKGLIVPENIFLEEPTFFYYWRVMEAHCAYRKYEFLIDQKYNRQYDEVAAEIEEVLRDQDVTVQSDARLLKKAIRPVEQRLQIQQMLEEPIEIAFLIVTFVISLLFSITLQEDVFLRLLWGESKVRTFLGMLASMAAIAIGCAFAAGLCAVLFIGGEWAQWVLMYLGRLLLISFAAMALPLNSYCNRNLVYFYQSRES